MLQVQNTASESNETFMENIVSSSSVDIEPPPSCEPSPTKEPLSMPPVNECSGQYCDSISSEEDRSESLPVDCTSNVVPNEPRDEQEQNTTSASKVGIDPAVDDAEETRNAELYERAYNVWTRKGLMDVDTRFSLSKHQKNIKLTKHDAGSPH